MIAQAWKDPSVPLQGVRDRMTALMLNEQMSSIRNGTHAKFLKVWEPWLSYTFHISGPLPLPLPRPLNWDLLPL